MEERRSVNVPFGPLFSRRGLPGVSPLVKMSGFARCIGEVLELEPETAHGLLSRDEPDSKPLLCVLHKPII